MHSVLSHDEHRVLLLSTCLHRVLCVPSDCIRPSRPGPVPILQIHTLLRAGECAEKRLPVALA